jgi:hypothetical protein
MRRFAVRTLSLLVPAVALAALTLGCGKNETTKPDEGGSGTPTKAAKGEMKELASTGWGTLKGKVTLEGSLPGDIDKQNTELLASIDKNTDKAICLSGPESEKTQQSWRVKDGAVENVVVWLRPPEGHYFKIDMADPTWPKEVQIKQPHCAFIPHVVTVFPEHFDGKKKVPTGQVFEAINNATMSHNTKWEGSGGQGENRTLKPGESLKIEAKPNYTTPIAISCTIHGWMNAYAWAFDHPYAAVTKEDGTYEIKHVPAGVDLQVVAWHEKGGWLTKGGAKGDTIKLKDGDNTQDFKVSAK